MFAFAMYLYKDEMEIALKEALRMAKMGGRLCFTHFILPLGNSCNFCVLDGVSCSAATMEVT